VSLRVPDEVADWITSGRDDVPLFAWRGFGIHLHSAQVLAAQNIIGRVAAYILLWWANRAGKTCLLAVIHLHHLFYKIGIEPPRDKADYRRRWLPAAYRTLHCAPLGRLTLKAYKEMEAILLGIAEAQWDPEAHRHRDAPLAPFFALMKERNVNGSDDIILRCENGACTDFLSTEGGAGRIEGSAWYFISWDEIWETEGAEPDTAIRFILDNRLTARAADHDATIVLTGTIKDETEHLAKEWITYCEDKQNLDWWGCGAERTLNPITSQKSIDRAARNLSDEDYARSVLGRPGGVKNRLLPGALVDHARSHHLPDRTGPVEGDGSAYEGGRRRDLGKSPWFYLHTWDMAIAEADNVGSIWRFPKDHTFSPANPIVGVHAKFLPGSRTLTDDEILLTIEEAYLPYGGLIYIDTTDAFGKNVARKLRLKGYPARDFDYHDTDPHGDTWKEAGEVALKSLLGEAGDGDAYGCIWIPEGWSKHYDQLSVLKPPPDDRKQRKDAAMTVMMMAFVANRLRPRTASKPGRLVFYGGH
jgi:hypothetical protein